MGRHRLRPRPDALESLRKRYPTIEVTEQFETVLDDARVSAVMIATPVATHYGLAREALLAGKHVFVEKPLAQRSEECRELIALAEERGLVLMPARTDHGDRYIERLLTIRETPQPPRLPTDRDHRSTPPPARTLTHARRTLTP